MAITGKKEPRFDIDYKYGRKGELQVETYLESIADGHEAVETKTKRILDLWFYVEQSHDPGRTGSYVPSGITTTEAEAWAFCVGETGIAVFLPTSLLRIMVTPDGRGHNVPGVTDKSETDGSCPTRGKLVNLGALLSQCVKRGIR